MSTLEIRNWVKCANCGATNYGYIREDGAVMVLDDREEYVNSWVYGCKHCDHLMGEAKDHEG